jgi:hypothetical protein
MTFDELYKELSYVNGTRENRLKNARLILDDLDLLPHLLTVLFMTEDKTSCKAAWILEFVLAEYLYGIIPYLDEFTLKLSTIKFDSAKRPVTKICEFITKAYYSKDQNPIKKTLTPLYRERIIECCFDWMINDEKVAVKVYSMSTLYLFGQDYKWIHPELGQILEQDYPNQSAAFQARAKHVLKRINSKK